MTDVLDTNNTDVDLLKERVANLTTHTEKVHFSFDVITSRWHTMLTDLMNKLKTELEDDSYAEIAPLIEGVTNNVAYAKAVGLYDLSDHLKNTVGNSDNLPPAALPSVVPVTTSADVSVIDNAVVVAKPATELPDAVNEVLEDPNDPTDKDETA